MRIQFDETNLLADMVGAADALRGSYNAVCLLGNGGSAYEKKRASIAA
jgi:hypothetical protein